MPQRCSVQAASTSSSATRFGIPSPRVADKVAKSRGSLYGAPDAIALAKGYFQDGRLNELNLLSSSGGGTSVRNMLASGAPSRALRPKRDD
jgi:NitT/TauT family transport system substrate-binding protein